MKMLLVRSLIAAAVGVTPAIAAAQHDAHQPAGQTPSSEQALVAACVDAQRQTMALVDAANGRLETSRQSNQPAAMRAAMDDLQTLLSTMRAKLASCAQLQPTGTGMPAGHTMPSTPGAASAPGTAASPDPHSAHGAGTRKMVMVMTSTDPARLQCPTKIDPKTAPKATYNGRTYYFCSAAERDEFLTDPAMSLSMRPPL